MTQQEILENLCVYDPKHPFFSKELERVRDTEVDCYCDNCFYGRDKLAREILRLQEKGK